MSGPRVTSGSDSKQDYRTPADFMAAVAKRFGAPTFDLAAHAGNHQFARYYGPADFRLKVDPKKTTRGDVDAFIAHAVIGGADPDEAQNLADVTDFKRQCEFVIPNRDGRAVALDALHADRPNRSQRRRWAGDVEDGLGWLNCEFACVDPWADACAWNVREDGVRSLLLTPAVFTRWHSRHIVGTADIYELADRLCFDGKNVFPKDCRISHFHPGATGKLCIWAWREDRILAEWSRTILDLGTTAQGVSSYPNARGVDGAAAIPRSENDATEARTETGAVPPGRTCEVVTRPGEQRPLFGGDVE